MIAAVGDAWSVNLGDVEEILHHLRVLEGLVLDLGQGAQIDLVAALFLSWRNRKSKAWKW